MPTNPDLSKVLKWSNYVSNLTDEVDNVLELHREAKGFLILFDWCLEIMEEYAGIIYPGIVGVFLFRIRPLSEEIDEWIWIIVGDLPPAYITCEECPNPATAIDAYIGAMSQWVEAAEKGKSVADLIPVNVPATKDSANMLKSRLKFLDERILALHQDDLN